MAVKSKSITWLAITGVALAVIALASSDLLWNQPTSREKAAALAQHLPENTLLLVTIADWPKWRQKLAQSDLAHLWSEPTVQAFWQPLKRTLFSEISLEEPTWTKWCENFCSLPIRSAFFALLPSENGDIQWILALNLPAPSENTDAQIEKAIAAMAHWRNPNKPILGHRRWVDTWCLWSRHPGALEKFFTHSSPLASTKNFRAIQNNLPADFLSFVYLQPAAAPPSAPAALQKIPPWGVTHDVQGRLLNEHLFVLQPISESTPSLVLRGAPHDAILFQHSLLTPWSDHARAIPLLDGGRWQQSLMRAQKRLDPWKQKLESLWPELGSEIIWQIRWPRTRPYPTIEFSFPQGNGQRVLELLNGWARATAQWPPIQKREETATYSAHTPLFANAHYHRDLGIITGKEAGITFTSNWTESLKTRETSTLRPHPLLERTTTSTTAAPIARGFLDTAALFDRLYTTIELPQVRLPLRLLLSEENIALPPLPPRHIIANHLHPTVMKKYARAEGILLHSQGSITYSQSLLGLGAGAAGASAYLFLASNLGDLLGF